MSTENTTPTPEDIREMSEDELEAFKREQKQRLDSAIQEEQQELNEEEQNALSILSQDAETRGDLAPVEVGEATLYVKTSLSGSLERKFDKLSEGDDLDDQLGTVIDAIIELVEDDDEDGPVDFQSHTVWEQIHAEHGSAYLFEVFTDLADPSLERVESIKSFRT